MAELFTLPFTLPFGGGAEERGASGTLSSALGSTVDATVRLQALDGTWETCGADRAIKVLPETLTLSANEWGPDKASFDLHRSPIALWPDIGAFSPVEVEIGGVIVWEGRTAETPIRSGGEQVINVQCQGWQYHLDDDVYQRMYVHSRLTDWKDIRSSLEANLAAYQSTPQVQVAQGGIVLSFPDKSTVTESVSTVGVVLDLGPNGIGKSAAVAFSGSTFTGAFYTLYCRGSDTVAGLNVAGQFDEAFGINPAGLTSGSGTFGAGHRYIGIFIARTGATTSSESGDHLIKITSASVFGDTSYASGGASLLHADTIVKDAIQRATILLATDVSQVAATSFVIPDFTLSKASTPRETIEAANAYHNYIAKILSGKRASFQPRPTDPLIEIGAWSGADIEDASANNGAEIYSRAVVEAAGPDGSPLSVERAAGQQPGVMFRAIESPLPTNPSFTTNTASWAASGAESFTRDTTVFNSAPASGKVVQAATSTAILTETFTGTFLAGVTYQLTFAMRRSALSGSLSHLAQFGSATDFAQAGFGGFTEGTFTPFSIIWTPVKDTASVTLSLRMDSVGAAGPVTHWVDDLALAIAKATLVDRRGFRRAKVIQMSSAITVAEGTQLADIFLQSHMTTPFKGSTAVVPGGVRTVQGGQPVHPSALLLRTQQLLRFTHLIDPDTGGVGRDGTIKECAYTHKDQKASITLDDARGNFDALLARLAVVQTPGS